MHFIPTLNILLDQMFLQDLCVFYMNVSVYVLQNILIKLTYLFYDSLLFILSSFSNKHQFSKFYFGVQFVDTCGSPDRNKASIVCRLSSQFSAKSSIMKTFIVLAASAIALASGLCLEDDEVVAMCTVGTPIGEEHNTFQA